MKTTYKYILISIIISFVSVEILAQDSLINNNNKKWQIGFNISNYRTYFESISIETTSSFSSLDYDNYRSFSFPENYYQWDFYLKRNFKINNKLATNIGFSFRYMPFILENSYYKDSICNITLSHINSQFALDLPIMIKYHLIRIANKNDFYVYGGIKLSLYNYNKRSFTRESTFYDPNIDQYVTYEVRNEYYNEYGSDRNGYKVLFDANIAAGIEYQYNSEIALSFEYTFLPRKILIVESKSNFDDAKGYFNENHGTYRAHFYWSIGASYLF